MTRNIDGFTATYRPVRMNDEPGWWFEIRRNGRVVGEGWSRGRKHHAEAEVRRLTQLRKAA